MSGKAIAPVSEVTLRLPWLSWLEHRCAPPGHEVFRIFATSARSACLSDINCIRGKSVSSIPR